MPQEPTLPKLAAVLSDGDGSGDAFISSVADALAVRGLRVGGVVQDNPLEPGASRCDMVLIELTAKRRIRISQNLGARASGCRLDSAALETVAGLVESSVEQILDVVIINKFGSRESEGGGFRQAILRALDQGVPVLVGLSRPHLEGWLAFAGDCGVTLPQDSEAVAGWLATNVKACPTDICDTLTVAGSGPR